MGGGGKSKKTTIGYQYFMGIQMILCYGPVDELFEMVIGERTMYKSSNAGGSDPNITSSSLYIVQDKLNLFGGKEREGGVGATGKSTVSSKQSGGGFWDAISGLFTPPGSLAGTGGDVEVFLGSETENASSYLDDKISGDIPAYRGMCSLVLKSFYFGNNPYIKDMKFNLARYPNGIPGESSRRLIGPDANPAHILYDVITNLDWGMGYTAAVIDVASFQAASQKLHAENFGISIIWGDSQPIEDFIAEILKHINASMYMDRKTGEFVLQMVRDDYVPASLESFDNTNIIEMKSFSRKTWGETINEVTVVYTDRSTGKSIPVTMQDMANIQVQGTTINQKSEYPGITREGLAISVANRDLQTQSSPLARVQFLVNRQAWDIATGQPFRLSWPKYGILDVVFRVAGVSYGTLQDASITIDAIEDVFALPSASYGQAQPSGWLEPRNPPEVAANRELRESNYWDIVQEIGEGAASALPVEDGYYYTIAAKPTSDHYNYSVLDRPGGSGIAFNEAIGHAEFAPSGLIDFNMETGFDTTFTYNAGVDINSLPLAELILIEDEIMQVYFIDQSTNTISVYRGMLDTLPVPHVANSRFYGYQSYAGLNEVQYTTGEVVEIKLLPSSGQGQLPENSAPFDSFTFIGRAGMPWNAGNLQVEGLPAFQPQGMTLGEFNITWAHRDRTQQTGALVYQTDTDIGPEVGVTYTLRLYNELGVLSKTVTGIAGNSYDWTTEEADSGIGGLNSLITTRLKAVRGADESYQEHFYQFRRADYGYSYGMFYGGYV